MAENVISVPRVVDSQLIKIFIDEILAKHTPLEPSEKNKTQLSTCVKVWVGNTSFEIEKNDNSIDDFIVKLKTYDKYTTSIRKISYEIMERHQNPAFNRSASFLYERSANSFIDSFKCNYDPDVNTDGHQLEFKINQLLLQYSEPVFNNENNLEIASAHHEVLTRLEGMSAELITKQYDQVQKLEQDKQTFLDERTKEHTDKIQALDDEYSERLKTLEDSYQQRKAELDERQKQIDDADNTTARRKTTIRMLEEVQEKAKKFDFSENVSSRSKAAMWWAVALVVIAVIVTIESALSLQIKQDSWFLYARITFSSTLLISSVVYLIRWYNSWANRIAQQELDNQKFIRDLNRAHLAVEMALEWNEKKDGAIPARLLDSLTDGLFKSKDSTPPELLHPAEQIAAALVKSSERITLPFAGGSLDVSGRKLSKAKPIKSDNDKNGE
ncbi:hypothetical protein [Vibrio spartinae]|uniref:Uncharacterized protein n=1 Tax=Vibrio spartinae TaxID=1918945 RepID=A0A1N6M5L5_9VIBR|nr:hypothetical protein [Vibrio spartinae]SIO94647.1 hypothetical protein VSP9026_02375 [Vibrio spartinae]